MLYPNSFNLRLEGKPPYMSKSSLCYPKNTCQSALNNYSKSFKSEGGMEGESTYETICSLHFKYKNIFFLTSDIVNSFKLSRACPRTTITLNSTW